MLDLPQLIRAQDSFKADVNVVVQQECEVNLMNRAFRATFKNGNIRCLVKRIQNIRKRRNSRLATNGMTIGQPGEMLEKRCQTTQMRRPTR